ncbi:hypothetical protein [Caballeronia sp. TF1N1]|uniref:hypothetical protein n=1 Tax=Caballeronia sp. TF1N1 TaxID=2878153 RepID=UPI001FD33E99|nr:hypothetical protein [Caballeronia sp. TF1N1]
MKTVTGESLYQLYERESWALLSVGVEPWHSLTEAQQEVWSMMAAELTERFNPH